MQVDPFMQSSGLKYPIFQGGMAWVADGRLAAAVSNAGGLGIIGAGHASGAVVAQEIERARSLTDRPIGVNVMLLSPHVEDVVKVILKAHERITVVTTGAGDPSKYLPDFKAAAIKVVPVVASVAQAKRMARVGADAVVAEGMESGGHIGKLTTMALVPQVVDALNIPVIAAGGIADGRGLAAAFMLGAVGVQMGTRFLVAAESKVHPDYKKAVLKAKDIDTVITGEYAGHPARVLKNPMAKRFMRLEKREAAKSNPDFSEVEAIGNGSLKTAVLTGDRENGAYMAGQVAGLVTQAQPAADILADVYQQATDLMGGD